MHVHGSGCTNIGVAAPVIGKNPNWRLFVSVAVCAEKMERNEKEQQVNVMVQENGAVWAANPVSDGWA